MHIGASRARNCTISGRASVLYGAVDTLYVRFCGTMSEDALNTPTINHTSLDTTRLVIPYEHTTGN